MTVPSFLHSFQSEWIKKKGSAAAWLVVIGGFFIPVSVLLAHIIKEFSQPVHPPPPDFWIMLSDECWNSMAVILMPMGIILVTSLIAQLEFKNNGWKQLFTTPQKISTIFLAKYAVIIVMLLQFFFFFNFAILLVGILASWLIFHVPYPQQAFPFIAILKDNAAYFLDCLPIVAFQYLLSIRYKNFLISIGVGFLLVTLSIFAYFYKYSFIDPYAYMGLYYLQGLKNKNLVPPDINIHWLAFGYFILITIVNYILFINRKERD